MTISDSSLAGPPSLDDDGFKTRRDFLIYGTLAVSAAGAALAAWPFIDFLNPAADTRALSTTEVDISGIAEGQAITVTWQGKPVFVRHRTALEIAEAQAVDPATLRDPQTDGERVQNAPWLVMIGICTHLGCIPLGQKTGDPKGDFDGWFCPCHGSHYDSSGRARKGPAPLNMAIPPYTFRDDTTLRIG
ncbi:ubiquinol-cytochrome c reductase iron-sulfur subunit [Rhodospirillum rubrum]|uniref:ubiquinol-cytochrome c reductase iron-sulfur subunit n=1 Tax=Rhodospirillum rubrum TaxID=1085 RepID=UPI001906E0D0|nr:ubiquinol-cytochrome c reductase iron-sulfur subunit [Rhodospirillum rubrum]MBK1665342.1 ubiquinol-cytochrome c reductase iron-sulfur subunit [Rhodospirillum rubrum]MBK1676870.1 ubiquinol-cytochrome c reductase iron-sulfur subunit [Rhodospirillum rubrum]